MLQLQFPKMPIIDAITLIQVRPMPTLTIPTTGPLAMAKQRMTVTLPTNLLTTTWTIR